jgi:hypothetical protein
MKSFCYSCKSGNERPTLELPASAGMTGLDVFHDFLGENTAE